MIIYNYFIITIYLYINYQLHNTYVFIYDIYMMTYVRDPIQSKVFPQQSISHKVTFEAERIHLKDLFLLVDLEHSRLSKLLAMLLD